MYTCLASFCTGTKDDLPSALKGCKFSLGVIFLCLSSACSKTCQTCSTFY